MNSSLKDLMKDGVKPGSAKQKSGEDLKNMLQGAQSQELFQNIINIEVDKLKKDAKEKKKEYQRQLGEKTNKINDLLTDIENLKTELSMKGGNHAKLESDNELISAQI